MKEQRLIAIQLHTDMADIQMEWLQAPLKEGWTLASVCNTGGRR